MGLGLTSVALTGAPGWIETDLLTPGEVRLCMGLLALRVALAFPHSVYQSVLLGSDRQVLGSSLNAMAALTSAVGGVVAVLAFGSVIAFYASEAIIAGLYLFVFRRHGYGVLPPGSASFHASEIRGLLSISLALMWTSGIGLLLSTLDRLFVTAMLPVASLGVYTLAVMGGRLVSLFYNPYLQAAYPPMCRIARTGSAEDQARDLARNQAVLLLIAAAAGLPLCGFAPEVLTLWVGEAAVVRDGAPVLSVYVAGSLMIGFAAVLYQWQTATGRTGVAVRFNAAALLWFPVALAVLISRMGLLGAALAWALYGALAWITNLLTTFGGDALPARYLRTSLRTTLLALLPAVMFTLIARLVADFWFSDALWSRTACGVLAGQCGGGAAWVAVRPYLTRRAAPASLVAQPVAHTAGLD
jgi:O-antigen/teichoic acid export membrane protein